MIEEWRDIKGFEGFYQVSNFGRVKSVDRYVYTGRPSNHKFNHLCEKFLKYRCTPYVNVTLSKGGKSYYKVVHRLVAESFIPNPNNYPCVNHKDEDKTNNRVDNLEWCTYEYNNHYNNRIERCREKISATLKGRKLNRVLTDEQRRHISEGAKRGWETRRRNAKNKC